MNYLHTKKEVKSLLKRSPESSEKSDGKRMNANLEKSKKAAMTKALSAKRGGAKEIKDSNPYPSKTTKGVN